MKNKNAFTLVEMLAVIVILGLIMIVTFPKILEMVTKQEGQVDIAKEKMISSAVETYLNENRNVYPAREGKNYCVNVSDLEAGGYLSIDAEDLDLTQVVLITYETENKYSTKLISKEKVEENCTSKPNDSDLAGLSCRVDKEGYAIKKIVTVSYPVNANTVTYCYSTNNGATWIKLEKFDEQVSGKKVKRFEFNTNATLMAKVVLGTDCTNPNLESATCTATVDNIDTTKIGTIVALEESKIGKGYLKTDGSLVAKGIYQQLYDSIDFSQNDIQQPPNGHSFYLPNIAGKMIKYQ